MKRCSRLSKQTAIRLSEELMKSLSEAAQKSGWTLSEQIRYELAKPRGLWKPIQPYLPSSRSGD